ncbi:hypothetical protein LY90DRAFT_517641 [Neocallimastix californiae]|uniref:CBM10 domain-containing protein n=1 Tax=Neocallimastix californiae TaxID=1754190 RepID=A0A1Y2A4E5_9FUNG|nr:hypothetical protein LY90DRAFT_517641 [Neocallimastix californiae]|eukprot:ORY17200.1 hypothetical protein LY90DRAFT_517641 [Neocallimastix californiae]
MNLGYSCCKSTNEVKYTAINGSFGYENDSWCGINKKNPTSCWAFADGYECCKNTKNIQYINKDGNSFGFENGVICALRKEDNLKLVDKKCWTLSDGYPCCESLASKVEGENDEWGYENGGWCGLTKDQQYEFKYGKPKDESCWSVSLGYPCCSEDNQGIYLIDENGSWGLENNDWCGIIDKQKKKI